MANNLCDAPYEEANENEETTECARQNSSDSGLKEGMVKHLSLDTGSFILDNNGAKPVSACRMPQSQPSGRGQPSQARVKASACHTTKQWFRYNTDEFSTDYV